MQKSATDYQEHRGLLIDHLTEVHGLLAAKITDRLLAVGSSSLKDLADYLRVKEPFGDEAAGIFSGNGAGSGGVLHTPQVPVGSATAIRSATDKEIKFTLATLLQHNVIAHDPTDKSYAVLVGQGLLGFLMPSFIRFVRAELGDAGDVVISLLARYSKLTLGAIEREVLRSAVVAAPQVKKAIEYMRGKGWIVACGGGGGVGDEAAPSEKRARTEVVSSSTLPTLSQVGNTPFEISFSTLLHAMRTSQIKTFAIERFDALGARIIIAMLERDTTFPSQRGNTSTFTSATTAMSTGTSISGSTSAASRLLADGFGGAPILPALTIPFSANDLYQAVVQGSVQGSGSSSSSSVQGVPASQLLSRIDGLTQHVFVAKLSELSQEEFGAILQQDNNVNGMASAIGGSSAAATYRLNYNKAVAAMRDRILEKIIFTRYGITGTRIMKLLMEKQIYEDRHLAEECICTLFEAREALFGMQRDGYVSQIEIPKGKVDYNAERNPKNSNYLWTINRGVVLTHGRRHLVTATRNTRARLLFEYKRLEERFPSQFAKGAHWLLNGGGVVASGALAATTASGSTTSAADPSSQNAATSSTAAVASLTPEDQNWLLKLRFACRALTTAQMAQMETMLMMDYF